MAAGFCALSVRCFFAMCSVAKSAICLRSAVISSSRRVISEGQSSKMAMAAMRSLSAGQRRASLSARYEDILSSSFVQSAAESKHEGVPMRRLLPCMTLLANVENDSWEVI